MSVANAMASTPKRVKVQALGRGLGSVWQRTKDSKFEHIYVDPGTGRQVTKTLTAESKTAAVREAAGRVEKIERGEIAKPSTMTLGELAEQFFASFEARTISGERSVRSLADYRTRYATHIAPKFGRVRAQSITKAHALDLLDEMRRKRSSTATVSAAYRTFARIVSYGRDRGVLTVDVSLGESNRIVVENARKIRRMTPEEVSRVVAAATPRWRVLIETAALTGARISELLGLQWADVDLADGTVSISKQLARTGEIVRPKTKNGTRAIRVHEHLRLALLAHYNESSHKAPGDFVFACDTGNASSYRNAARALENAIAGAGIEFDAAKERLSFHCFRHSVASQLLGKNVDAKRVADYLGDDVATVLSTYTHSVAAADENLGAVLAVAV